MGKFIVNEVRNFYETLAYPDYTGEYAPKWKIVFLFTVLVCGIIFGSIADTF